MKTQKKIQRLLFACIAMIHGLLTAQNLPSRWDELTASDWEAALEASQQTCILPLGVLEKHGPHVPIGSDLIKVRQWSARATKQEYAVVFPDYFYGQINEAKQQYGTFSLPPHLVMELLEATCAEIARNGFKKIIIINGHGGNPQMIRYFIQNQLASPRDYAVYFFDPKTDAETAAKTAALRKTDPSGDQHAGEKETATLLYMRPDLVQLDRAASESGENLKRLDLPADLYTGIWWYAAYPNHYAGSGAEATAALGKHLTETTVNAFAKAIRAVKNDTETLRLQNRYFNNIKQ